jgi:hypothetical protein
VWFVEVKTKSGYLSPLQRVFRDDMSLMGCNYCTLYGAEDVDHFLDWVVTV